MWNALRQRVRLVAARDRLPKRLFGVRRPTEADIAPRHAVVRRNDLPGVAADGNRLSGFLDHQLILSGACGEEPRHEPGRDRIARVGLRPQAERLAFLFEVAGHLPVINRHDEEAIAVGRVIAQLVGFAGALFAEDGLPARAVQQAQLRMRNRETWIDLDGAFEQRDRRWRADRAIRRAVGLQRVERGGAGLLERCRVLPHGGQRFADACPELRRELAEDVQDVFFPRRLDLFLVEQVAGRAVLRAQAEDVLRAEARNRSPDHRGAAGADADVARHIVGQRRRRRLPHQLQRPADAIVGDEAEKRRLPELHGESLSKRLVEHRVARRVDEVGEHDGVFVGQRRRTAKIRPRRDCGRDDDRRLPTARVSSGGERRRPARASAGGDDGRRADSRSRFSRCRSARISDACW